MDITRRNVKDELFAAMVPYVERLRDPEVVASTDAAKAASVIRALYEKCVEVSASDGDAPRLSRREAIDILTAADASPPANTTQRGHTS